MLNMTAKLIERIITIQATLQLQKAQQQNLSAKISQDGEEDRNEYTIWKEH